MLGHALVSALVGDLEIPVSRPGRGPSAGRAGAPILPLPGTCGLVHPRRIVQGRAQHQLDSPVGVADLDGALLVPVGDDALQESAMAVLLADTAGIRRIDAVPLGPVPRQPVLPSGAVGILFF